MPIRGFLKRGKRGWRRRRRRLWAPKNRCWVSLPIGLKNTVLKRPFFYPAKFCANARHVQYSFLNMPILHLSRSIQEGPRQKSIAQESKKNLPPSSSCHTEDQYSHYSLVGPHRRGSSSPCQTGIAQHDFGWRRRRHGWAKERKKKMKS